VGLPALWAIQEELTCVMVNTPGLKLDTLFYDTTNFLTLLPAHHPELLAIPVNDLPSPGPQQPTRSAAAVATDAHALGSRMEGGFAPQ